ncbi:beta-propeller domain-containing protein [Thalassotalea psychrophila]|uniref:Beta-propeller domain-containing protein n=1 Tax=Thalassotalea psychrophila TaxID=3065647 RepID=A0ABY9TZ59_9GAMM|nr:beta-propeller domain-containing protein [Colwelliaceae bacterium SQ149]
MNIIKSLNYLALIFLLASCGSDSSNNSNDKDQAYKIIELDTPAASTEGFRKANNADETLSTIRNNMLYSANYFYFNGASDINPEVVAAESAPTSSTDDSGSNFSKTNLIEAGVDEADRVKYDGDNLYILAEQGYGYAHVGTVGGDDVSIAEPVDNTSWYSEKSYIRIMEANENNQTIEISRIESTDNYNFQSLYLNDKQLTVFANDYHYNEVTDDWGISNYQSRESLHIFTYDTSVPAIPTLTKSIEIEGYLLQSRRIDNKLYVISSYNPNQPELTFPAPETDDEYKANEEQLAALPTEHLLPMIRFDNQDVKLLNQPEDCYIPADNTSNSVNGNIINISVFDLTAPEQYSSTCINGYYHDFYMSENAIYLTSTIWSEEHNESNTVIQQMQLNENGVDYRSTGIVPGYLGQGAKFRINENNGLVRIVTTKRVDDENDRLDHQLFLLQTNDENNQLEAIGQLPNNSRSKEIGKANEDIFAVRFFQDRVYVVTFERTDPLYVIDLSNPDDPLIAGELEIPGFSTYLHPLGENYLFGIGQEGDGRDGVKLGLFDISQLDQPKQLASTVIGDRYSWSQALYEHHAISILNTEASKYRLAFPVEVNLSDSSVGYSNWDHTGLYLFDLDLKNEQNPISNTGVIKAEQRNQERSYPYYYSNGRSVIDGDNIHYIHGPFVFSGVWQQPELAVGPQ